MGSEQFLTSQNTVQTVMALCNQRKGDLEDATMGNCLHSVGIDPINTMDAQYRERFSLHREDFLHAIKERPDDNWYFDYKPLNLSLGDECCSEHMITYHGYKHDMADQMRELHKKFNVEEGVDGKSFEVPSYPRSFLHRPIEFVTDEWRNSIEGQYERLRGEQLVYLGPGRERV